MKRRSRKPSPIAERPEELPIATLAYRLTPQLVRGLTWAHRTAGEIAGLRLSYYNLRKLQIEARHERITWMVNASGHSITMEEVARVVAGDLLPRRRSGAMEWTRRASLLCDAVDRGSEWGRSTTPEICSTYMELAQRGDSSWVRHVGSPRTAAMEIPRDVVDVPEQIRRVCEWIDEDDLVSDEPVLRAATLNWALTAIYPTSKLLGIDAVVDHELRAGSIDKHGLLVLRGTGQGTSALHWGSVNMAEADRGDLTPYFETFANRLADALVELRDRLRARQDDEERLPWLTMRPPDELDRQIFEAVESLGSALARQILDQINDPPPLRTLQRRLHKLCTNGLITKHGGRRDAFYRLTERS